MDTGKVEMYVDGRKTGDKVHYELAPGEEKLIPFIVIKTVTNLLYLLLSIKCYLFRHICGFIRNVVYLWVTG